MFNGVFCIIADSVAHYLNDWLPSRLGKRGLIFQISITQHFLVALVYLILALPRLSM